MKGARRLGWLLAVVVFLVQGRADAAPVGTAFTYQGLVQKNGVPVNGACSIRFTLYDALTAGSQVGNPNPNTVNTTATKGLFTAMLDFGVSAFTGTARWLEIEVQGPNDLNYTLLTPRQPVTPVPYAIHALNGGGGGLTLPFSGSVLAPNGNAFGVTNTHSAGTGVFGDGGFVGVEGSGGYAGVYGHSNIQYGVEGVSASGGNPGVRGRANGGPGVQGISVTGAGLSGTSASGHGVYGTTFDPSMAGVRGEASVGYGVEGISSSGLGVRGQSNSGTGVHGQSTSGFGVEGTTSGSDKAGVLGRNESAGSDLGGAGAQAVFGYASRGAVGVYGVSEGNDGVVGLSNADWNAGVLGNASRLNGFGGWFSNSAGGVTLRAEGLAQVRTLQILGSDLAESFPVSAGDVEPGTVLEIVGDAAGTLRESREAYNPRVAGVASGANGLATGVILEGRSFEKHGKVPVAMSGRVWVKCDATRGPIRVGDLLTTSSRPGHAMRASDASRATGAILGKAMTSLETGTGLVLALVSLQ